MTVMASIPTTRPGLAGPLNLNPQPGDAPAAERFAELFEGELPLESGDASSSLPATEAPEDAPPVTGDAAALADIAALLQSATPPPPIAVTLTADAFQPGAAVQANAAVTIANVPMSVSATMRALSANAVLPGKADLRSSAAAITTPDIGSTTVLTAPPVAAAAAVAPSAGADAPAPEVAQALGRIARLIEETISGAGDSGAGDADTASDQPQSAIAEQLAALRKGGFLPGAPVAKAEPAAPQAVTLQTAIAQSVAAQPAPTQPAQPATAQPAVGQAPQPAAPQVEAATADLRQAAKRAKDMVGRATLAPPTQSPRTIDGISVGWRTTAPAAPAAASASTTDSAGVSSRVDSAALQPVTPALTAAGPIPAEPDLAGVNADAQSPNSASTTLSTNGQLSSVQAAQQAAANASPTAVAAGATPASAPAAPPTDQAIAHQLTLAADGEWLDQLATDIARTAGADGQMRFNLNPRTLGSMIVEVRQSDLGAVIHLATDTEAARAIVAEAQPRLLAEARAQGMRIADAQVSLHNQASGSGTGQSQRNGQPPAESRIRTAGTSEQPHQQPPERRPAARSARYA